MELPADPGDLVGDTAQPPSPSPSGLMLGDLSVVDGSTSRVAPVSDDVVCVVGGGYVGIVTAVALAAEGRRVHVLEVDATRCDEIRDGHVSFTEPGVEELLVAGRASGHLHATCDPEMAVRGAGLIVIATGTPPLLGGGADLRFVRSAIRTTAAVAGEGAVVVLKSSVPPGTAQELQRLLWRLRRSLSLVLCPEFLSEGTALHDFQHPARLVIGGDDPAACTRVATVFQRPGRPTMITDTTSAEMIKYASNAFLALKISFINEIAHLCDLTGADIDVVADGIGADERIGRRFLNAGAGFGGSCFPKDMGALEDAARRHGHSFRLLGAAVEVNIEQRRRIAHKVAQALGGTLSGRRIAVLGLAFKPGTDDIRQAPALEVIKLLQGQGVTVAATDPIALVNAARELGAATRLVTDPYDAVKGAEAVVLMTEWPEYVALDWQRVATLIRRRNVIDARNCLSRTLLAGLGFRYAGIGRRAHRLHSRQHPTRLVAARSSSNNS